MPQLESFVGDPLYQVVVPLKSCEVVLQISHDQCGHLGVRKMYDRVMRYFFLASFKKGCVCILRVLSYMSDD